MNNSKKNNSFLNFFEDCQGFNVLAIGKDFYKVTTLMNVNNLELLVRNPESGKIPRNLIISINNPPVVHENSLKTGQSSNYGNKFILLLNFGISDPIKQGTKLTKTISIKIPATSPITNSSNTNNATNLIYNYNSTTNQTTGSILTNPWDNFNYNSINAVTIGSFEYKKFNEDTTRLLNNLTGEVFTIRQISFNLPYTLLILNGSNRVVGKIHCFGYSYRLMQNNFLIPKCLKKRFPRLEYIRDFSMILDNFYFSNDQCTIEDGYSRNNQNILSFLNANNMSYSKKSINKALMLAVMLTWAEKFRIKQKYNGFISLVFYAFIFLIILLLGYMIGIVSGNLSSKNCNSTIVSPTDS